MGLVGLGLAHELSTPLTSTALGLQLLLEEIDTSETLDRDHLVSEIETHVARIQRMGNLIHRFRAFARGDDDGAEVLCVSAITESVADLLRPALRELGAAWLKIGETDVTARVHMDRLLLEQTLAMLVLNARDAVAASGRTDGLIQLHVRVIGADVVIEVVDNGPGFVEGLKAQTPGATTKQSGGLGVGLSLATAFVESAGGQLVLANREGQGARVAVHLPLAEEP